MVGKGVDLKTSRIFHQCYLKCCKLQNLTPLSSVLPSANGKVLDFCVDRIKYADWPPILNAVSCDLSLHSVSIRCRQQVKTVLEQIDCERLAKTVNKRAVILTNFMLTNLMEAISQLLSNTTLLTSLLLEGLPLKIPYLNPLTEVLLTNSSLQHVYLPRCLIGDAGCLAICKAVRCLPNILTLDLSGCELTALGAGYIAELIKYQKIHRYSENWIHTLRYRLPELDAMAGLRRITLCANPQLGDVGVAKLIDVLSDDLWIKALDIQNCGLSEQTAVAVLKIMQSNTTLVILDTRHNMDISMESLSKIRAVLRGNERGMGGQYSWLGNVSGCSSDGRSVKSVCSKNGTIKERVASTRSGSKFTSRAPVIKKEKDYTEVLEDQLQDEISHRQQLEELNLQLVDQMKQLKQQQIRLWANAPSHSGSEQSFQASSRSMDLSSSSESTSSVPIDQNTLSYIQQAFKDIYAFIKNNQCQGQCLFEVSPVKLPEQTIEELPESSDHGETHDYDESMRETRVNLAKRAQSTHTNLVEAFKMTTNKTTKSAHLLGDMQRRDHLVEMRPEMFERQMGDTRNKHDELLAEELLALQLKANKKCNSCASSASSSSALAESSDTLVASEPSRSPVPTPAPAPRAALFSSSEDDDYDSQ